MQISQLVENERILKLSLSDVDGSVELLDEDESVLSETRRIGINGSVQHRP